MSGSGNERRHHDPGGLEAGPIDREEHDKAPWEKRVDALMVLLEEALAALVTRDSLIGVTVPRASGLLTQRSAG